MPPNKSNAAGNAQLATRGVYRTEYFVDGYVQLLAIDSAGNVRVRLPLLNADDQEEEGRAREIAWVALDALDPQKTPRRYSRPKLL